MSKPKTTKSKGLILAILAVILAVVGYFAVEGDLLPGELGRGSSTASTEYIGPNVAEHPEYYEVLGEAKVEFDDLEPGQIDYCELDDLGRTQCAVGLLTTSTRQAARDRGRQDISSISPSGWPKNQKAVIPSANGKGDYSGWFWNRSHLMADSLGGDPIVENLVTGTRSQNVGNRDNQGGMVYTEEIARQYLDSGIGDSCPLYYAAVPEYEGNELIPRYVMVDILSCDSSINERVKVFNEANGYVIDYNLGEIKEK